MRRLLLSLALPVASATAVACGGDDATEAADRAAKARPAAAGEVITIQQFAFSPSRIEVKAGTTVRWQNGDPFRHTVTSGETSGPENVPDGRFDENLARKGSAATVTFAEQGTFTYFCRQHNAMDGTVVVT